MEAGPWTSRGRRALPRRCRKPLPHHDYRRMRIARRRVLRSGLRHRRCRQQGQYPGSDGHIGLELAGGSREPMVALGVPGISRLLAATDGGLRAVRLRPRPAEPARLAAL